MFKRLILLALAVLALLCFVSVPVTLAQEAEITRFGAFGLGYFAPATPQFQGWSALAIPVTADGKALSYTDSIIAVVPDADVTAQLTVAGKKIRYTLKTGLAYRAVQFGSWSVYGLAAPGFVADGDSFKSAFAYGGFVHKSLGKGWGALLALTNEIAGGDSNLAPRVGITKKF